MDGRWRGVARPTRRDQFSKRIARLRELAPPIYPVSVRRVSPDDPKNLADCSLIRKGRSRSFLIRIRPEAGWIEATDSLIHEWGHALAWSEGHPTLTDHDPVWGVCFSKAYLAVFPDPPPP